MNKIKEWWKRSAPKLENFFASDWFVLLFAGIMMFGWLIKCEYVACILMVICLCLIFLTSSYLNGLIPILCMFQTFIYGGLGEKLASAHFIMIGILVIPLILSIVYYFVHNKKVGTVYPQFKKGKLFWGLIAVLIAVAFGGLGYEKLAFYWILISAGFVGLVIGIYLLLLNRTTDEGFKSTACKSIFALGAITALQVVITLISASDATNMILTKTIDIGWATSNPVAMVMAFVIPIVAYLGTKSKMPSIHLVSCFVFAVLGFLMQSRGIALLLVVEVPVVLFLMLKSQKNRKNLWISLLVSTTALAVFASVFNFDITLLFSNINNMGLSDNGRYRDWEYFYNLYTENRDFGIGFFGYSGSDHIGPLNKVHSTIFQIWFCTGIVGTILFVVHYFERYKLFLYKPNMFKIFALVTLVVFELYGLIDMTLLMYYLMIALFVIFVAVEKEPISTKTNLIKSKC